MKIGLLGGSFDPVHIGHIALAQTTLDSLHLDEIWFLLSGYHPQKKNSASLKQRISLLSEVLQNYPKFKVSDEDLTENEFSYTLHLVKRLKRKFPQTLFYFIIGFDNAKELTTWHNPEQLVNETRLVVLNRKGINIEEIKSLPYYDKLHFIEMKTVDVSSSEIRNLVKRRKSISGMIPKCIENKVIEIYK